MDKQQLIIETLETLRCEVRPEQVLVIEEVLSHFEQGHRTVALECPTGWGKSVIALVTTLVSSKILPNKDETYPGFALCSSKFLADQYEKLIRQYHSSAIIKGRDNYACEKNGKPYSQGECHYKKITQRGYTCKYNMLNYCEYPSRVKQACVSNIVVTNYSYFFSSILHHGRVFGDTRLVGVYDEAHNLEDYISKFYSLEITLDKISEFKDFIKELGLPLQMAIPMLEIYDNFNEYTVSQLSSVLDVVLKVLSEQLEILLGAYSTKSPAEMFKILKQREQIELDVCKLESMEKNIDNWVSTTYEDTTTISPIAVDDFSAACLGKAEYNILMSATLPLSYIEENVITDRPVYAVTRPHIFPAENRANIFIPVEWVNNENQLDKKTLERLSGWINAILHDHFDESGVIHVPSYYFMNALVKQLDNKRIIRQKKGMTVEDAMEKFKRGYNKVLISPAIFEGVDLPDDLSRFQIIPKVPWRSLGDNRVKRLVSTRESWYKYQAIKTIIQASGRSIRHKEDYAVTYILDNNFETLYKSRPDLFPQWWRDSVILYKTKQEGTD